MILTIDIMVLGIVSVIYVIILGSSAIKIMSTYRRVKNKVFIYTGVAVLGTTFAWSGVVVLFLGLVFFNILLPLEVYFLFHGVLIPIASFLWLMGILELFKVAPNRKKWYQIIFGTLWISIEIIYLIIIFVDVKLLGILMDTKIQVDYSPFYEIILLIGLAQLFITNFWLAIKFIRSADIKIQLRGKFFFIAVCSFVVSATFEILVPIIPILIIARFLVMIYAILFYIGFLFPSWVEKRFFKELKA